MADDKLAKLFETQQSLSEWLHDIRHKDAEALRREDNDKRERLKVLNEFIGLPFDQPVQFEAAELTFDNPDFKRYIDEHGDELCALRLIPKKDNLPKLRMRGKSIREAFAWFREQAIDPVKYRADFVPHGEDSSWATIFVVNQHGIQGEIIHGGHHQLTQGFHDKGNTLMTFRYDFTQWYIEPENKDALAHLQQLVMHIYVPAEDKRAQLTNKLGSSFAHDYLEGYFETTDEDDFGIWFKDYSPTLGKMYADLQIRGHAGAPAALLSGQTGCPGKASGKVCIVDPDHIDPQSFPEGAVLVCKVTTPKYVPLMQKATAIVTDQGGILSHAAIVARELKKPCIVATGNATSVLKDGQLVLVDADAGTATLQAA